MKKYINIGDVLYHYNKLKQKITESTVILIENEVITIKTAEEIGGKHELKLQMKQLGEWLFFKKEHIELTYEELANIEVYRFSTNPNIEAILKKEETIKYMLQKRRSYNKIKFNMSSNEELFKIKEVLKKRNITELVHFTKLENLESILKYGFVPQNDLDKFNINAEINDKERYDNKKDCTSFSVTFPNDLLFYNFRCKYPHRDWVVIILDSEIVLSEENICFFCQTNAANKLMEDNKSVTGTSFENMFTEEFYVYKKYSEGHPCKRINIPDNFTTDVQAEVLIKENIDKKYIKKVVFDSEYVMNNWCKKQYKLPINISFEVLPQYFGWRDNFFNFGDK